MEASPPALPVESSRPGEGFAIAILVVTFVFAALAWIAAGSAPPVIGTLVWAAVLITAILAFFDARRLAAWSEAHPTTEKRAPMVPVLVAVTFVVLWAVVLPVHFWRRRRYGGGNLFWPALAGALILTGAAVSPVFLPNELPAATAPEVVQLVQTVVQNSLNAQPDPSRYGPPTISNVVERSFDKEHQIRDVKCTLTTKLGPEDFYYTVEWQDRGKNMFQIKTRATP
jgi:hypothetical protein